jgi:hypothetical protein
VAKRTRGSRSVIRPGQQPGRAAARTARVSPTLEPPASSRYGLEPAPAIPGAPPADQTDSALLITEAPKATSPVSHQRGRVKVKPNSLLAARAAEEYLYVGKDMRRIVTIAAGLGVLLLVLWLLLVVFNLSGLY